MTTEVFVERIVSYILDPLIGLMFALAVLYFSWGIFKFIANSDNEEERNKGKQNMVWGILGMVIMVGVWGIMHIIANTLGVQIP